MNPRLISLVQQLAGLYEMYDKPIASAALRAKMLSYSIFSEMFSSAQSIRQANAHSVVADAKAYIELNYMETHTLTELSGRYGMSGKYFSDVFKKHTGVSPFDFLLNYRLEQARKLLESTACGYTEYSK